MNYFLLALTIYTVIGAVIGVTYSVMECKKHNAVLTLADVISVVVVGMFVGPVYAVVDVIRWLVDWARTVIVIKPRDR